MAPSTLAGKLQIKPGQTLLLLNKTPDFVQALLPLPEGVKLREGLGGAADVVFFFAHDRRDLAALAPAALAALGPEGALWVAYPKKTAGVKSDLNRDAGWEPVSDAGWEPVRMVAVDAVWSAIRFRQGVRRSVESGEEQHFAGAREVLRPIYDRLRPQLLSLGSDVELSVRESYIAFSCGRQFAVVKTRSRPLQLELGLRLPETPAAGRLQPVSKNFGSEAVTHQVNFVDVAEVDAAVLAWLRAAYAAL